MQQQHVTSATVRPRQSTCHQIRASANVWYTPGTHHGLNRVVEEALPLPLCTADEWFTMTMKALTTDTEKLTLVAACLQT